MFGSKVFASLLITTTTSTAAAFKKSQLAQCAGAEKQPSAAA
jgi:hypothetical protein